MGYHRLAMDRCVALLGFIFAIGLGFIAVDVARGRSATRPPNVLLIVSDDMGWNLPSYHKGWANTPNIDRIARSGVELDRFYVSPMCSPTRAGLMTGRYPMRFGMARSVVHPWSTWGLPTTEVTLADALARAGYPHRAAFGKWHLGHMDGKFHPLRRGFTEFHGCYTGEIDYYTHERVGEVDWHDGFENSDDPGYVTDLIADYAIKFIGEHAKDGPFFCYAAFTAPHTPFEAPRKYVDEYKKLSDNTPAKRNAPSTRPSDRQSVAAMTACLDDDIGRILAAVDRAGIAKDTLIFFINDNGGIEQIPGANAPLRGGKFHVYEGGVRVPAAVWWPGHIEGPRKIESPLLNLDVLPTILALCAAPSTARGDAAPPLDGQDVSQLLLHDDAILPRDLYSFTGQRGLDDEEVAVTTFDGWKLIVVGPDVRRPGGCLTPRHKVELLHLSADPAEQHDLAAVEPQRVRQLAEKLVAFRRSEAAESFGPMNRKPADFKSPPHWYVPPPAPRH
jgi:arylsulfatase B